MRKKISTRSLRIALTCIFSTAPFLLPAYALAQETDSKTTATAAPIPPTAATQTVQKCEASPVKAKQILNVQYQTLPGVEPNLQSVDIYAPDIADPCIGVPVVIWVHGGGWQKGDKSNLKHKISFFNSLGYVLVSVNYRLSKRIKKTDPYLASADRLPADRIMFPDHPNDVGAAVAWISKNIKNYGGRPDQLALLGHSAGGHLVALVGLNQSYITKNNPDWRTEHLRCVGSYDIEGYDIPRLMQSPGQRQKYLYNNTFGTDPTQWVAASPIQFVRKNAPAMQLARRGNKKRHEQVDAFKEALEKEKNVVSVIDAQGLSHNEVNQLIGAPKDRRMTPFVAEFLAKTCFSSTAR